MNNLVRHLAVCLLVVSTSVFAGSNEPNTINNAAVLAYLKQNTHGNPILTGIALLLEAQQKQLNEQAETIHDKEIIINNLMLAIKNHQDEINLLWKFKENTPEIEKQFTPRKRKNRNSNEDFDE